jgi:dihydrofolate reductase
MRKFLAIAAMAENRVIGRGGQIPWHLPDDFRFFKRTTLSHVLVMGRKTFESIGRPLPGRDTIVLTRSAWSHPGVVTATSLDALPLAPEDPREVFICGGAQAYAQALPRCSELYLTHVHRTVEGDTFFPPFEEQFELTGVLLEHLDFTVRHYRNRTPKAP